MNVKEYIENNWDNTTRLFTEDDDTLIGLPHPYTVPCIEGKFQEMYYWDVYFTNVGLIKSGRLSQAKNNVDNMCYLINNSDLFLTETALIIFPVHNHLSFHKWFAAFTSRREISGGLMNVTRLLKKSINSGKMNVRRPADLTDITEALTVRS